MPKKKEYSNDDIVWLKGADRVRKKPSVIFGSDGLDGCEHAVFEIISNSIDEARAGYGNRIIITRFLDHSVEVQDFGRGMPVDWNEKEKKYNWELLFCELYAGGKYDNESTDYAFSLGTNGLGLCSTQYASEYMDAEIHTGGFKYELHFERGEIAGEMKKTPYDKKDTGTRIKWRPDLKVFKDIGISLEYYKDVLHRQAVVNAGVKLILKNEISANRFETTEFLYDNGIVDYVKEIAAGTEFTPVQLWQTEKTGKDREDLAAYKVKINAAVCFSNKVVLKEFYHNSSWLEHGGAPEIAVRNAFRAQMDAYLKQQNKYTKSDPRITFQDVEESLIIVVSSFSTQASYANQTKKAVTNKFIQEAMTEFFRHQLEVYFIENKAEADKIADQVLINMRSRVHSEKMRSDIKKTLSTGKEMLNRVEKFVDCRSKDVSEREIFIVEGDSALGACKQARDSAFQAVIPVRGKILNCLKSEYGKIFKNEIITDLIKVLGCGVEVQTKQKDMYSFSLDNLRWSKVIICTDADVDGYHIRTLILTMIYRLMPTLINAGKVFIAESPLYEINSGDQTWFAYSEIEKNAALEQIGDAKYTIQRSKGLGENDADMMWLTTMNPKTRRLIKVDPEDAEDTAKKFDLWLGDDLQGRKEFISQNGYQYLELADLS
ncbi:MAG: DNA topoisomerase [Clostridia bacterium]|nr:DNA topoisomerase [Clostridia bacterium]